MLKIKDNVALKELEQFGYIYENDKENRYYKKITDKEGNYKYEFVEIYDDRLIHIYIDDEIYQGWTALETLDVIYDLIQAGIVEKI